MLYTLYYLCTNNTDYGCHLSIIELAYQLDETRIVVNSLGDGDTYTCTHVLTSGKSIFKKPSACWFNNNNIKISMKGEMI